MNKRVVLLLMSCAMCAALVLGACSSPSATTTTTGPTTTTSVTNTPPPPSSTTAAASTKPQYGGTLTYTLTSTPTVFDPVSTSRLVSVGGGADLVNQHLIFQDWSKGLAGTGQVDWTQPAESVDTSGPGLVQSWTIPSPGTVVMELHQGVHWGLNPDSPASQLMGGREVTPEDVISNFNYQVRTPRSALVMMHPVLAKDATMTKTGPWEVTMKTTDRAIEGWFWLANGGGFGYLLPPDVVQKYGSMQDWHNVVGTGPYMLTDLVSDTEVTFEKNPNYWETNPVGPGKGDQLPYINSIHELIIPDVSTQEAALRTAKIDLLNAVQLDDAKSLTQTTPDLKSHSYYSEFPEMVSMRTDLTNTPFHDVKVRQALMMGTDFNALSSTLYGGAAQTYIFPISSVFKNIFVPMNQLPQNVQSLFQYNPDQAKQLLADAGYPNGFQTTMIVEDLLNYVDVASAVKAMWAKIGVDVTLKPEEVGAYDSVYFSRKYDQMLLEPILCNFPIDYEFTEYRGESLNNGSHVDDPPGTDQTIEAAYTAVQNNMFVDFSKADDAIRQLTPYILEQSFYIPTPTPETYDFWWPWVKNYNGEPQLGFTQYHWLDKALKTQMGH